MDKFREAAKQAVLKAYKDNFNTDLDDKGCEEVLRNMLPFTDGALRSAPDFSEAAFEMYMRNAKEITFSPECVYNEINKIILEKGQLVLNTHNDYKRAREMEVAARLCLANKKMTGAQMMIYAQDNPDIILALPGAGELKKKTIPGFKLEVMEVRQADRDNWADDFIQELVEFIKLKKFNKRYGDPCNLIVYLNFDHQIHGLNVSELNRQMVNTGGNPYNAVFVTTNIQGPTPKVGVFQVSPHLALVEFTHNESGLMY